LHIAENDIADVLDAPYLAWRPDQILFATLLDIACPDVAVVAVESGYDVLQRQPIGSEFFRAGRNLVFLGKPADRVDFGNSRHIAQLRFDDPILYLAQIGRRIGATVWLSGSVFGFYGPQVNFPQTCRNWPRGRRNSSRKLFLGFLNTLIDQLASEIDVRSILENHRDLGQAITRQGAGLFQMGQSGHDGLDRIGHPLLNLQW